MSMMHIAYEIDRLATRVKRGTEQWLWGIVNGWDGEDSAMDEIARICGWDEYEVARLRSLHDAIARILDQEQQP